MSYIRNVCVIFFFFQAEDGIRDLVRSRGLGDVYKRQVFEIGKECPLLRQILDNGLDDQASSGEVGDLVGLSLIHI